MIVLIPYLSKKAVVVAFVGLTVNNKIMKFELFLN